ncbi:MAG: response regulator [Thermoflexales bacterium]|nr:response regulator [Thermoflexales bacterium]
MAKILIAEDEKDIRELVTFTLSMLARHQVIQAVNGLDAVEKAKADKPDLILMDGRMPHLDGYQACAQLKEIEETKAIPVVFLSAKGQESEIQDGLTAGADGYILKPFAPDDLIKGVNEILSKHGIV